jgi:hypothetical protein
MLPETYNTSANAIQPVPGKMRLEMLVGMFHCSTVTCHGLYWDKHTVQTELGNSYTCPTCTKPLQEVMPIDVDSEADDVSSDYVPSDYAPIDLEYSSEDSVEANDYSNDGG